jgi:hypothetical protein
VSENPYMINEKEHHAPRITVWVTISSHGLPGSIYFEERVNNEHSLSMLRNTCVPHLLATGFAITDSVVHAGWGHAAYSECCFGLSAWHFQLACLLKPISWSFCMWTELAPEWSWFNPYTAALEMFRARKAVPSLLRSRYFERNFRARMNYVRGYSHHSNFAGTKSHLLGM